MSGRTERVGAQLLTEREHLLPLAAESFDLAEISFPRADQTGCAKVRTNSYSVPLKAGSIVEARVTSTTVEFRHHGTRIASHERCYSRMQKIFDLEHYFDVLDPKPARCADQPSSPEPSAASFTSATAPVATGWSESCQAGFVPTERPCLCTAHQK